MTFIAFPDIDPPNEQTKFETYPGYEWAYRLTQFFKQLAGERGGGFPQAEYVTMALSDDLTQERVLTAGTNITIVDGGPNAPVTINASGGAFIQASYTTVNAEPALTKERKWVAGTGITLTDTGPNGKLIVSLSGSSSAIATKTFYDFFDGVTINQMKAVGPIGWNAIGGNNLDVAPTNTNRFTSVQRFHSFFSNQGHTSWVGWRASAPTVWRGNAARLGGFFCSYHFGLSFAASNLRAFVGWYPTPDLLPPAGQEPSSLTDCLFMGIDSTDTFWQIMSNDAVGTCTKVSTGFSSATSNTDWFEVTFSCVPNGTSVDWSVTRLNDGAFNSGTLNANLPTNSVFLTFQTQLQNGAMPLDGFGHTANASIDVGNLYIEAPA